MKSGHVNEAERQAILTGVASYYSSKLEEFGATPQGVDWNGEPSHQLRHRQFLRLLDTEDASVIDVGCGFGDFYRFLRSAGYGGHFTGLDISAEMIAAAVKMHGQGPDRTWKVGALAAERADYAVASGLLNVKGEISEARWEAYAFDLVEALAKAGTRGFGFNVLTLSSDPERRRSGMYYADPLELLRYCLDRYGRSVALLQDYGLYELTLLVRHQIRS